MICFEESNPLVRLLKEDNGIESLTPACPGTSRRMTMKKQLLLLLCSIPLLFAALAGCSTPQVRNTSAEDNPEHHYLVGMNALDNGKFAIAKEKFERAVYLNERYAKGYAGLAIASAEKAKRQEDAGFRQVEIKNVFAALDKADKYADTPAEEFCNCVAQIRVQTLLKEDGWLDEAQQSFTVGNRLKINQLDLPYYQGTEALSYFMGVAYLEGLEFQKARDAFAAVLNSSRDGKWNQKADAGWKKTDRIVRAMAGITVGNIGKQIATQDSVSRADLAALLVDEVKLDTLFAGRIPVNSDAKRVAEFTPVDVLYSPFKDEVLTTMKWKVRGLEPKFDEATRSYLFYPAENVSRGEMAFILEDVLIKMVGDEKLASAYFGQDKSPFPDVRNTSPLFNAVMNMTTRGIMEGELSGEFRPNDPVDGADALLAVRVLSQRINIH